MVSLQRELADALGALEKNGPASAGRAAGRVRSPTTPPQLARAGPRISVGAIPPAGGREIIVLPLDAHEQVASLEQDTGLAAFGLLIQRRMQATGSATRSSPIRGKPGRAAGPSSTSRSASSALPGRRPTVTASRWKRMCPAAGSASASSPFP